MPPEATMCNEIAPKPPKKRSEAAVAAVIQDSQERVLLTKRSRPPKDGIWHLPGGGVDPGEHHLNALLREMREELGIEVRPNSPRPCDATSAYFPDVDRHVVCLYFTVYIKSGVPVPLDGTSELMWASEAEVRALLDQGLLLEPCRDVLMSYMFWRSLEAPAALAPQGSPCVMPKYVAA
jgi:8-oxo-dGTP diphosphatase